MKVLLVDDEKHVRSAIRLLANWEAHGITDVIEADSVDQAIELITQQSPQIVITDMRMPGKDGVVLMEWIQANASETKVLVVSGYDDFQLVRQAIRCGGMDYILKPVEQDEINTALSKAADAWRSAEQDRRKHTLQAIEMNQMRPHYMDKMLTELISNTGSPVPSLTRLREELSLPHHTFTCRIAVLSIAQLDADALDKYTMRRPLLCFSLMNICSEFLVPAGVGVAFRHVERMDEIIVLYWGESSQFPAILNDMNSGIFMALQRHMHMGISSSRLFPLSASVAYQEARQALCRRNLLQSSGCLHLPPTAESTSRFPRLSDMEEKFRLSAISGSASNMSAVAGEWVSSAAKQALITTEQWHNWNQELDWMLAGWLNDRPDDTAGEDLPEEQDSLPTLPVDCHGMLSLPLWQSRIEKRLQAAGRALTQNQSRENHIICDIARYLDTHYDEEISLQEMAGRFYLSREYISRKFKQEYGVNLSEYLCRIRIDKAKVLLLNPQLRLHHIAAMVGYQDEKYFGKVFKKLEGVTPGEFRRRSVEV